MEGNTQACLGDHRQIIGTVTHGNRLGEVHFLHLGYEFQQFRFPVTIYDLSDISACEFSVFTNLEFIGIHIVDTITTLQIFTEIGESTREDGNLITTGLQNRHQTIHTLGDGQVLGNLLHYTHIESLQQGHTACKTLLEINLSTHGALSDGTNLCPYSITLCQLIDTLGLDEGRVHIETDQTTHTTEHIIALEREVYLHLLREFHQFRLHLLTVDRFSAQ